MINWKKIEDTKILLDYYKNLLLPPAPTSPAPTKHIDVKRSLEWILKESNKPLFPNKQNNVMINAVITNFDDKKHVWKQSHCWIVLEISLFHFDAIFRQTSTFNSRIDFTEKFFEIWKMINWSPWFWVPASCLDFTKYFGENSESFRAAWKVARLLTNCSDLFTFRIFRRNSAVFSKIWILK